MLAKLLINYITLQTHSRGSYPERCTVVENISVSLRRTKCDITKKHRALIYDHQNCHCIKLNSRK
uniref:Uncharacterized protein n=1 Tax=Anguilla anguilla TaxID=7936 RepID=A0A0E9QFB0_ANGAN